MHAPTDILFLDIETVPLKTDFDGLDEKEKMLFEQKLRYKIDENTTASDLYEQAGIWAEFGKVIVVSFGKFKKEGQDVKLHVRSFANDDEVQLLKDVKGVLDRFSAKYPYGKICAHNGKEFDFPFLARRMIINRIPLPEILKVHGKKPWETGFCDTLELWRFGDFKHYTSLDLLTHILGIPTPKDDIKGSDVARVYYEEKDLERIARYCSRDVVALVNVWLRINGMEILKEEQIVFHE